MNTFIRHFISLTLVTIAISNCFSQTTTNSGNDDKAKGGWHLYKGLLVYNPNQESESNTEIGVSVSNTANVELNEPSSASVDNIQENNKRIIITRKDLPLPMPRRVTSHPLNIVIPSIALNGSIT